MGRTPESRHTPSTSTSSTRATANPQGACRPLEFEWWPTERPIPYARNPRIAPEASIAKVAASIAEYGWRQLIVVDPDGVIVVGHTRLLAAKRLGLTEVPVYVATDLTTQQIKAYRLADNRTAEESSWDLELLPLEIAELADLGYDLDVLGFNADELAKLAFTPTEGLTDPDEVPEPADEAVTQRGDLWLLGEHRLLCGDATKAADVERLMDGRRAGLMASAAGSASPAVRRCVMPRSTAAEVARRVDALYDLLLQGVGRHGIQQYAAGHGWQVSPRQLDTYARRAKVQLAKAAERDRAVELGRALERLDLLFMKALAEDDRAEARAVLKDTTELLGLGAAQRHELAGPGGRPFGASIAERAAQFLAGLENQAISQASLPREEDHE